jgi:SAM-dependent methyltransferase
MIYSRLNPLKGFIKWIVPYGAYKLYVQGRRPRDIITQYYSGNRIPFSLGYQEARFKLVEEVIYSHQIDYFISKSSLPENYGFLFDERVVEYPWIFANLNKEAGSKLLDIGPALNHEFCINYFDSSSKIKQLVMLSITPEANCFYQRNVSYYLCDTRSLPFLDNYFDQITCVSTLEHIGMDNTKYGSIKEFKPEDYKIALIEMKRILKHGGLLLITVPFGKYSSEDVGGSQQRFDRQMIEESIKAFEPSELDVSFYSYSSKGWNLSSLDSCVEADYNSSEDFEVSELNRGCPVRAGAIACMKFKK